MKGKLCFVGVLFLSLMVLGSGPAFGRGKNSAAEKLYDQAKRGYYTLVNSKANKADRTQWTDVISSFEEILDRFPDTQSGYKAAFTLGRLYQKMDTVHPEPKALFFAQKYYERVVSRYRKDRLSDDALFHIAEIQKLRNNPRASEHLFKRILKEYPNGDQVIPARKQLALLKASNKTPVKKSAPETVKPVQKDIKVAEAKIEKAPPKKPVPQIKKTPVPPAPVAKKVQKKKGALLIVLDPGHGGKDDGAKGRRGLLEKNVNLDISKRVKTLLEKRYKYKVVLTRTDDTFIELPDRGALANKLDADLFVSIHANAAPRKSAMGIETYYLGSGSSDRALETAARENGELVDSVPDDEVQQILASLISTTKINDSARLAARVQKRLHRTMSRKYKKVNDLGVKEGPFFVLHDTNMPSILVEVGFVTNSVEEKRLAKTRYLYWLAESIAQGIHEYLGEKAPAI